MGESRGGSGILWGTSHWIMNNSLANNNNNNNNNNNAVL